MTGTTFPILGKTFPSENAAETNRARLAHPLSCDWHYDQYDRDCTCGMAGQPTEFVEPQVRKWPPLATVAFVLVTCGGFWIAVALTLFGA